MRDLSYTLAIVAATALLTLACLEGYLRLTQPAVTVTDEGPVTGEVARPSPAEAPPPRRRLVVKRMLAARQDVEIRINALGFRGPETSIPKPPGETRVLALGDSITFAASVPEPSTFVARLEAELRAAPYSRAVTVVNAGVNNSGLSQEVDLLLARGFRAEPDVLLVNFYLNDSRPPWGFHRELGPKGWLRRTSRLADTVYTQLMLRRWLHGEGRGALTWVDAQHELDWAHDRHAFLELATLARRDWGAAWQPDTWRLVDEQLDRLARAAADHDKPVVVASFPVVFQVQATFVENLPQRFIAERAAARGFGFVDLLPALRAHADGKLYADQCHLLPDGHRIVAAALAPAVASAIARVEANRSTSGGDSSAPTM